MVPCLAPAEDRAQVNPVGEGVPRPLAGARHVWDEDALAWAQVG